MNQTSPDDGLPLKEYQKHRNDAAIMLAIGLFLTLGSVGGMLAGYRYWNRRRGAQSQSSNQLPAPMNAEVPDDKDENESCDRLSQYR